MQFLEGINVYNYPDFISQGVAPCATMDPELYFPERGGGQEQETKIAKRICNTCQYKVACLEWAVDHDEVGIWGGTSEKERRAFRRQKRRIPA